MPKYIVLEKNGYRLKIRKVVASRGFGLEYDIVKVKHNRKTKNAPNLLYGKPVLRPTRS